MAATRTRLSASGRAFAAIASNRDLRRAQGSFAAAFTAEWAFTVALGVVAFRAGGAAAVGVVGFVRMAPAALLSPVATALADRLRRDRVLAWSSVVRAAATAGAGALVATGAPAAGVYVLAVVATAAFTVFRPAHSALLPMLCLTPVELTSANAVRGLLDSLSTLIGPLAAALLLGLAGPASVFALAAALSLGAAILLTGLGYEPPPRRAPPPLRRIVAETLEGFAVLRERREAAVLTGVALTQTFTRGCLTVFLVVVPFELLDTGEAGVGVLAAAVGAGAVLGSLGATLFVTGRHLAVVEGVGVVLWGAPLVLMGVLPFEVVVLALMAVIGCGNALVDIGLFTLIARLVPEAVLARVFGAFESMCALTVAAGALVTPAVISLLGVRGALAALGFVAPLAAALAWRRLAAIDRSVKRRDEQIAVLKRVRIFEPLPMPAIELLAGAVGREDVAAGDVVFSQGERGDTFYVVEDGEADVLGDARHLRTLRAGDGFGEIALLRDTPRTATIVARTPLRLYALDRRSFLTAVGSSAASAREADVVLGSRLEAFAPDGWLPSGSR